MRKLICLLAAALLLAGCSTAAPAATTTKATVPNHSPMEMLGNSVANTLNASSFVLECASGEDEENLDLRFTLQVAKDTRGGYTAYWEKPCGCAEYVSGKTYVYYNCESNEGIPETAEDYLDMPYLLRLLPTLEESVLERFCNTALTATPTRDGGMRFEISDLDKTAMEGLLGEALAVEADFVGFFAIEIDAAGNLAEVFYTHGPLIYRIRLTKINQKIDIARPDWA